MGAVNLFSHVNWNSSGLKYSLWPSPTEVILTVGDNLIEINTTRKHGSKRACFSQSSENCSFTLETLEVGNTRRRAMTSVRKSGG